MAGIACNTFVDAHVDDDDIKRFGVCLAQAELVGLISNEALELKKYILKIEIF